MARRGRLSDSYRLPEDLTELLEIAASDVSLEIHPGGPTTDAELWLACRRAFGTTPSCHQVCDAHVSPFRAFADAYFARTSVSVWKASRGFGGKSFSLALLGLCEAVFLGADVTVLGGSGMQSARVYAAMRRFWHHPTSPFHVVVGDPLASVTRFQGGNEIVALAASQKAVRGPHPQRLRCDEVDEMELDVLHAAFGQTKRDRDIETQTVLASTHQYDDGPMTWALREAEQRGWPVYEWCYRENIASGGDGYIHVGEVARKQAEVTLAMWDREYELQEPSALRHAIDRACVDATFSGPAIDDGDSNEVILEEPIAGERYLHGADWAREQDYTVIVTLRLLPSSRARLVAYQRVRRQSWPEMIALLDSRVDRYGGDGLYDGIGVGNVVGDYLRHGDRMRPFIAVGRDRDALYSAYIVAVESRRIEGGRVVSAYDEHRNMRVRDLTSAGHVPDSVCAMALAWRAVESIGVGCVEPDSIMAGAPTIYQSW